MNATIIIPDVNLSNRSHILAKDSTAVKYVSKVKIQEEINVIMARIKDAKANITAPQKEVKSKTDLMDLYGYLYRECEKYNAEVLAERQAKVGQESAERALKSSNRHERKAARLKELKGRFNPGLTVDGVRRAGWVFSARSYTVDTLRQAIFA